MFTILSKIRLFVLCLVLSIVAHVLFARGLNLFGTYEFTAPVNQPPGLVVELASPGASDAAAKTTAVKAAKEAEPAKAPASARKSAVRAAAVGHRLPAGGEEPRQDPAAAASKTAAKAPASENTGGRAPQPGKGDQPDRQRTGGAFLAAKYEKLTYQLLMFEIPVGTAELEAKYEDGETLITLRIRSSAAVSSVYPVDDVVEIRHVVGFIMAKIRQQEGSFRSDELFTINPGKKRVTWFDNIHGRSLKTTVPNDEVLDSLSAIYYLRNRQLEVGRTETLHIFDSEIYAAVPVEILAREEIRLPNLTKVNTLVVRPLQQTAGIFRRTGDLLIWLTDDGNKVPVKIVTSIALGKVTAELISAESKPHDEEPAGQPRQQTGPPPADGQREVR